jgi:hypothetical protein
VPYSDATLRPWIAERLLAFTAPAAVEHIVDAGAGAGTARDFYGPVFPAAKWTAIEVWEPYVAMFGLDARYDEVLVADVREADLPVADLYLFGDVLEHMSRDEALAVWGRARKAAPWLVISMPVLDYPQGPEFGNPHEAHLHQWDMDSVLAGFPGIVDCAGPQAPGSTVGAFIARGAL